MTMVLEMLVENWKKGYHFFFPSLFNGLGDLNEKRYFFSSRKSVNENKSKRAAGSGYWKPIGKDKQILASGSNQAVGMRKALIFCEGKRSYGTKTRWVMHEYRLVDSETNAYSTQV